MNVLGVVAGVGPFAGVDFQRKFFLSTRADSDQDYLRLIAWQASASIPDRTKFLEDRTLQNPGKAIARQALELERAGADILAVPCNTAHARPIFNKIRRHLNNHQSTLEVLDMIGEVGDYLVTAGNRRVGLLATTGTVNHDVYSDHPSMASIKVVVPDDHHQHLVHEAIYNSEYGLKVKGGPTAESLDRLEEAARYLRAQGAQSLVLGCTELPLAIATEDESIAGLPTVDASLLLARAAVRSIDPLRLMPLPGGNDSPPVAEGSGAT